MIPSDATLGAIVRGIQIAYVDDKTFTEIMTAWHEHAVLVFEEQNLTDDDHLAFSRRFGRLERGLMWSSKRLLAHLSYITRDGSLADPTSLQVRFNKG
ncbi:MAG: TauD/TfdA family dioxygenase, partial [Gammaproteobacteria bacterium]|nr:TauD/TfdA family dioxygenase [Gammaproteobacteria bacterium]